ncbi:hypothetical protein [Thiocapsa imhoffii]|uniref:hypothetical protein n=1 Tax=Thiocapsa imhoffii TaxID=382777 RepID=UPI001F5B9C41|nr:hypothetical protein [Thiocapsa imhoffii]
MMHTDTASARRTQRQMPDSRPHPHAGLLATWLYLAIAALTIAGAGEAHARPLDEQTQAILVEAVEAAYALDLYHARCRSDGSNRRTENLNKLIASRQRITVLRVQDDLFPERNYRRVQERLQREFMEMLSERGGCAGVKDSELPAQLRARYDEMMRTVEALP